jgi:hypothetical protein
MQHQGGKKPGRKPGSGNKKRSAVFLTREYDSGKIMPLEVQLEAMRLYWTEWTESGDRESLKEATMLAQAAGPYCHPRLQAIDQRTTMEAGDTLSALLRKIDGNTTGIARGLTINGSPLAIEHAVHDPDEGGS